MKKYNDPILQKSVTKMHKQGLPIKEIAARNEVSTTTVKKIIDPDFIIKERERLKKIDQERAEKRRVDPDYIAYQDKYQKSEKRLEAARIAMAAKRASNQSNR